MPPPPDKPSLDLLRALSDRHVLGALAADGPGSRADLAQRTGLSKPTVGQSVARLLGAGIVAEAGQQSSAGRGRAGTTVALAPQAGAALALVAGPEGVTGELVDLAGRTLARRHLDLGDLDLPVPVPAGRLAQTLLLVAGDLADRSPGPVRVAAVSIAGPVDQRTGRAVRQQGAPFLDGELDVRGILAGLVPAERLLIDNDVNWSVLAEHRTGGTGGHGDVLHLHLGAGLGAALLAGGHLVRGSRGLAGEIAHATAPATSSGGDPLGGTLLGRLRELGLLAPTGHAADPARVLAALDRGGERARHLLATVGAVARSACHLLDPGAVLLGGPWGVHPTVVDAVTQAVADDPGLAAEVLVGRTPEPSLAGARAAASARLLEVLAPH